MINLKEQKSANVSEQFSPNQEIKTISASRNIAIVVYASKISMIDVVRGSLGSHASGRLSLNRACKLRTLLKHEGCNDFLPRR